MPELPAPALQGDSSSILARHFGPETVNYYAGSPLNRYSFLRSDAPFLRKAATSPTLLMDLGVFVQYFVYKTEVEEEEGEEEEQQQRAAHVESLGREQGCSEEEDWDHRPLLQRIDTANP